METLPEGSGPAEGEPAVPDFDAILENDLGSMMLSMFQDSLRQRDPQAAEVLARGLNGALPGQAAPGVRVGDLVVALVGGFQPYVLRPAIKFDPAKTAEQSLDSVSEYTYVGECYLHGVMAGEPFKTQGWFTTAWTKSVKLVDITIV